MPPRSHFKVFYLFCTFGSVLCSPFRLSMHTANMLISADLNIEVKNPATARASKTILHVADGYDVFKFVDMDTRLVEIEDGTTENESVTRSVRSCIEQAVLELIYQGHDKGFWEIKEGHRHPHQANGKNDLHPIKEE